MIAPLPSSLSQKKKKERKRKWVLKLPLIVVNKNLVSVSFAIDMREWVFVCDSD